MIGPKIVYDHVWVGNIRSNIPKDHPRSFRKYPKFVPKIAYQRMTTDAQWASRRPIGGVLSTGTYSWERRDQRKDSILDQEYGLKLNQLSRYAPHMVADSSAHMNKFLYRVSDLVKIKCRNAMLLGDMNISRLLNHAQQVEGDKLREQANENKKVRTVTMTILSTNRVVEIAHRDSRSFWLQPLHQLVFYPPITGTTRRVDQKALNLKEVFQAPRLTPLSLSLVRTIRVSVLREKRDVLGAVNLVNG